MLCIALIGALVLIAVTLKHKQGPGKWVLALGFLANVVFLLAATFMGTMAISNVWL